MAIAGAPKHRAIELGAEGVSPSADHYTGRHGPLRGLALQGIIRPFPKQPAFAV